MLSTSTCCAAGEPIACNTAGSSRRVVAGVSRSTIWSRIVPTTRSPMRARASTMSSVSHGSAIRSMSRWASGALGEQTGGPHRLAGHLRGVVLEQLAQLAVEHVGHQANHPGGLGAAAQTCLARLVHHPLEHQLRRLEVLRASGPGQKRDHRRADREVGEVADLLDEGQRIGVGVPRHIEQRLGAHLEMRVAEQFLDFTAHREDVGLRQQRHGPQPHLGRLVGQQARDGRMHGAGVRRLEQAERVEDLGRIAAQLAGQHLGRIAVEHRRAGPLGVDAVLVDAVLQVGHVARARRRRGRHPRAHGHERHPADPHRVPAQPRPRTPARSGRPTRRRAGRPPCR